MSEARQYWSKHLAAIAAEGVSSKAYAEREGLVQKWGHAKMGSGSFTASDKKGVQKRGQVHLLGGGMF